MRWRGRWIGRAGFARNSRLWPSRKYMTVRTVFVGAIAGPAAQVDDPRIASAIC